MAYTPVAQRKTTVSTGGYTPVAKRKITTYTPVASRVFTELPKKQLGTGAVMTKSKPEGLVKTLIKKTPGVIKEAASSFLKSEQQRKATQTLGQQARTELVERPAKVVKFAVMDMPKFLLGSISSIGKTAMEAVGSPIVGKDKARQLASGSSEEINNLLYGGKTDSWQEIKEKIDDYAQKSDVATPWEKKNLGITLSVAGFVTDSYMGGFGKKKLTEIGIKELIDAVDEKVAKEVMIKHGIPKELVDVAAPGIALATSKEEIDNVLKESAQKIINETTKGATLPPLPKLAGVKKVEVDSDSLITEARKYKSAEDMIGKEFRLPLKDLTPSQPGAKINIEKGSFSRSSALPIDIEIKDGKILVVDGNHRYYEALKRGDKDIRVRFPEYIKKIDRGELKALNDLYNQAVKPKGTLKSKTPTGKEQLAERESLKLARQNEIEARQFLEFPDTQLESQYSKFKQLKNKNAEDVPQLKRLTKNLSSREIDDIFYSQDKTEDEVLQMFKDRYTRERVPLTKVPKETKAIVAEKTRQAIKNNKDILKRRRDYVRGLRDQFGLDDSDLKKLSRKDIRLMSNYEFKQFIDDLEQRAIKLADTIQAKAELMYLIETREFKKVENYRKALELPAIKDMSASQLRQYAEALEEFQVGDEFLTTRTIETIDRTDMSGVRTIREIKERLLKQVEEATGKKLTIDELEEYAKVPAFARMTYDTALAEKNPFWKYTVQRIQEKMISGQARALIVRDEVNRLAKLADASRKRGLIRSVKQFVIPKHEEIIRYLEAPVDQKLNYAKFMTKEELDYANYVSQYYSDAYEHLVALKELQGSRFVDQYFTHTRKTFLEKWSDDGIIEAFKNMWQSQKDDAIVAKIIDQDTGKILPKAKFFQYTLQRTGDLDPSQNLTKVFNQYVSMFERKKMFDNMIPEIDAYTQALTPKNLTPKGLEMDRSLKTFMNEYLNNKKGRRSNFGGVLPQNGALDIGLRMSNTLVSLRDLGFNIGANVASLVGEQMTTYQALGKANYAVAWKRRLWDTGIKRLGDKNANKILKEAQPFIGRNIWTEMFEANQQFGDRALQAIFGIFSQSTVEANKIFLLGSLTKEELRSGAISTLRMAELRLEAGRWRDMGKDVKSIVGSTSFGQSATKYKGWAIPILRTNIKNITELATKIKNKQFDEALTSRELQETYRAVEASIVLLVVGNYVISQDDDESFAGKMKARVYQEAMTLLGGIDPTLFLMAPRNASFMLELAENLKMIAKWEEYEKTSRWGEKGELKGFNGLLRQLTPSAVKQFTGKKKSEDKTSIGLPKLPKINAGLPKLPKISI